MKTPIVALALDRAIKEYQDAPEHIRTQYDFTPMKEQHQKMKAIQEDPILVVNEIREILYDRYPDVNYLPGTMAKIFRFKIGFQYQYCISDST